MSSGINRVVLFGNLGADPELRTTNAGQLVLKLRVATNDAYYDKSNTLVERTEWHNVTMFGNRAEPLAKILAKGDALLVEGSIHYSSWEKDGVTRYRSEVIARDVCLATRRRGQTLTAPPEPVEMLEDPFAYNEPAGETPAAAEAEPAQRPNGRRSRASAQNAEA